MVCTSQKTAVQLHTLTHIHKCKNTINAQCANTNCIVFDHSFIHSHMNILAAYGKTKSQCRKSCCDIFTNNNNRKSFLVRLDSLLFCVSLDFHRFFVFLLFVCVLLCSVSFLSLQFSRSMGPSFSSFCYFVFRYIFAKYRKIYTFSMSHVCILCARSAFSL